MTPSERELGGLLPCILSTVVWYHNIIVQRTEDGEPKARKIGRADFARGGSDVALCSLDRRSHLIVNSP